MDARRSRKLLLLLLLRRRKSRRLRRKWVRNSVVRKINTERLIKGEYHSLIAEMRMFDTEIFFKYFRMTPSRFDHLLSLIGTALYRKGTVMRSPVSPGERLAVTLRFLATGDSMQTTAFSYRLGHSTVCRIIDDTCEAIWNALAVDYLRPPSSQEDWKRISESFYRLWNFPNCIGAIDGKHIVMQAPHRSGSTFFNYKKTHSIVLMAVCDAHYCFTYVDIGDYGRHSDGGVFSHSNFGKSMEHNTFLFPEPQHLPVTCKTCPYVFVADEAFSLKPYLLHPYAGKYLPEPLQMIIAYQEQAESLKTPLASWQQSLKYSEDQLLLTLIKLPKSPKQLVLCIIILEYIR